jgi:hypothetical protein
MRKKIAALLVVLVLAVVSSRALPARASLSREAGLRVMRGVLTLEVEGFASSHRWDDLATVVQRSERDPAAWRPLDGSRATLVDAVVDASTATILDYRLQLTRSDDATHLQVTLTPHDGPNGSRPSWFADEHGVIFVGQPIR